MKVTDAITYRLQDILHRILTKVSGSQSTINPVYGDSVNLPDIFYVDSGNGSDTNDGRDPAFPLATIDAAINKCTASQGDVIMVQPGHSETLTAAIELDVIGVSVIGVGEGTLRPQLTLAADDNGIEVSAVNCKVENIYCNERTTTPTSNNAYVDVSAANCKLLDLHFDVGAEDLDSITLAAGADSCEIGRCKWVTTADGPDSAIRIEAIIDLPHIHHCVLDGGTVANAFDEGHIVSGSVHTNCLVEYNTLHAIVNNFGLLFTDAATGVIQFNTFSLGTLGGMLDPGSCMCIENYEQDAVDESGLLVPGVNPAAPGVGGAHGTLNDATTDTLHGKLGEDSNYGDRSLWDQMEGDGFVGAPSAIYPAINTNIQDILLWLADGLRKGSGSALGTNESVADVLYGANGIVGSWPASGAPTGTGVSIAQALRYISENIRNTTGAFAPGLGLAVVRAADNVLHDGDTTAAFTIAGGRVLITALFAEVTTAAIAGGASNFQFVANPSAGATQDMCANLDIDGDAIGTQYSIDGVAATALLVAEQGMVLAMPNGGRGQILQPGTIDAISATDKTAGGSLIQVTLYYIPMDSGATVVAA
ncbi:hypothetical protein LCGC14_0289250 [marine sediment metagenome]|uniref:Uncharacterized protein n=1 Tax=marine sediment metagenome TaxID=412755 RepID=A0A0F9WZG0_9ZZZZ